MEYLDTVIGMVEKVRDRNKKQFENCPEDKIQQDFEYSKLYQAYWGCDIQLENILDLLKVAKITNK